MPTIRSFAELAGFRPPEPLHVVNLRLARAIASLSPRYQQRAESDELARLERRPSGSRLGGGVCEDTLRMALRPIDERREPARAGRDYDPRLDIWTKRKPCSENRRPRPGYVPVSLQEGKLWRVVDRVTGVCLWQIRGPFAHATGQILKMAKVERPRERAHKGLNQGVEQVKNGMSIGQAAELSKVSRSVLERHCKELGVKSQAKRGPRKSSVVA